MPIPPDDDIDDDTLAAFQKVLNKFHGKNPKWLTELFPNFSPEGSSPKTGDSMTTFLQGLLTKEETKSATLAERLEVAQSVMTPEQLTQFRLAIKSAAESGKVKEGDGPKPGEPPSPLADPPVVKKPKRLGWL